MRTLSTLLGIGLSCLYCLSSLPAQAAFPQDWKNVQEVRLEQAGLVKINLPLATIDSARQSLEDLRLIGADGREIPYLLERPAPTQPGSWPVKDLRVTVEREFTVVEIPLGHGQTVKALELESPAEDFIKAVSLDALSGEGGWQPLAQGVPIYRLPKRAGQLMVEIPPGAWTSLRLTLDDRRSPPIPITAARLYAASAAADPVEELPVTIQEHIENLHETHLTLQTAGANVTLAALSVETPDPLFTRTVTLSCKTYLENTIRESVLTSGTLFRVAVEGLPPVANLTLTSEVRAPSRELLLTIHNADNPPLQISGIRALRRPVYLIFLAPRAGSYYLLSGNRQCKAPDYDLTAQRKRLQSGVPVPIQARELVANPDYRAADLTPEVQVGGTLDMTKWKYRKGLKISRPGVQQVDLDLEVLSRATIGLSDLRVISAGKQLPYLVQHSSSTRAIVPALSAEDDPKRPKTSRWSVRLPLSRLPLSRFSVVSDTLYFKREVRLIEEFADERNVVRQRLLQSSRWVKTPEEKQSLLELSIPHPISSDRLFLEIDNGDNPPLVLKNPQVWYPITQVLFKTAEAGAEIFLYYGNRATLPPQYDLDVIAPQLVAAAKSAAAVGPEEPVRPPSWKDRNLMSGTPGVIFWVGLVLVVGVLLYVISRLLPRGEGTNGKF
ncbi:MAG: hypothetical protein AB2L11_08105 [Syntrophobacteraceae bacterium]